MKKQKVYNQEVAEDQHVSSGSEAAAEANSADDNVTDNGTATADTMAEERASVDEAAEWRDKYLRLQAEFDNFRKRTLREKMELVESGGADVLKAMLSVLDDVYRAVDASQKSDDITALREGNKLVAQKFAEALRQRGVTEIEAAGKEFDADLHEAVAKFPAASEEQKGKIIDVVQRGYKLGEKILRYAKVVVGE
ncbi:MAG: nucleotide exchange factor GrpE [Alistipes sp.]|nr:nucleotide exchange factor GrpE [Alistipes sp.]